jgi:hypothetical protein
MRKTSTLQSAQALALAAVCAIEVGASGLVQAQAPAPVAPAPAQAPAQPPPAAAPTTPPSAAAPAAPPVAAPVQAAPGAASPAAPVPGSTTEITPPPADPSAPALPEAAEPTSPPAYVEPLQAPAEPATIEAAPTIDEQLALEPKSKVPSYVMWAVGGASLITGAVLGISALTAKSDFDDKPSYDAADKVEGRAVAADIALGLSAVLLVTGTVFYFLPDAQAPRPTAQNPKRPTARWQVAPMLGRTNGGALSVQF